MGLRGNVAHHTPAAQNATPAKSTHLFGPEEAHSLPTPTSLLKFTLPSQGFGGGLNLRLSSRRSQNPAQ